MNADVVDDIAAGQPGRMDIIELDLSCECKGIAETREYVFDPDTQIGVGINPGVTQAVSAASRALAPIKPHLQHLAAASSAGTSLVANLKHITVTLATWDAVWEVYLDPKWAWQRLWMYGAQDRALEQFFKKHSKPAKRSKRTEAELAAEPTQPTTGKGKGKGKAAKAKPAPQPGRWLDRDCNAALNMQRIGESRWRPLELCYWPDQGALPAKGKEYPGLGYKRLQDKPPKAQEQQQPAVAQ
ncbi:hypothetical protein QJQ45_029663 [Haematococcus lacustris]|nr:hypothetical protein QJQ45_029663 [Haematococcus lacustris]